MSRSPAGDPFETDVLVVGGGLAGLSCALTIALSSSYRVCLVESQSELGGALPLSRGNFCTFTSLEKAARFGTGGDPRLQELVITTLDESVDWLAGLGVHVTEHPPVFDDCFSMQTADAGEVLDTLRREALTHGVRIWTSTEVQALAMEPGGFRAEARGAAGGDLFASCVVLAGGGFPADADWVASLLGRNASSATIRAAAGGVGLTMRAAVGLGAALTDRMDTFYGHALPDTPSPVPPDNFALLAQYHGKTSVAINLRGERFVDESDGIFEETVNWALAGQEASRGYYIFDAVMGETRLANGLPSAREQAERAEKAGAAVIRADSLAELGSALGRAGVSAERALNTLTAFNCAVEAGTSAGLAPPRRGHVAALRMPPFTAVPVRASITATTGGLRVDESMAVLTGNNTVIPNLFAVGQDIGGVSGTGYAGGLATALTSGRAAARSVVAALAGTREEGRRGQTPHTA